MNNTMRVSLLCLVLQLALIGGCFAQDDDWWQHAQLYQIYPRSFKDSNGDGIGDIQGIKEKLSHLADIGVNAAWISPIFVSPMKDFGYDIEDFYNIAPEYGTMQELKDMMAEAKRLGIRILLDYVPNHTSDQCEWFKKSVMNDTDFRDFYVWHPGKMVNGTRQPPSNWISVFRGSMWTFNEDRQEYYLHQFLKEQPDLNYRNPAVVEEMNKVMNFWLKQGASGFRVDAIPHLVEVEPDADGNYPDEPHNGWGTDPDAYDYHDHIYTRERQETWDVVYGWRKVTDDFAAENKSETKILLMEAMSDISIVMQYYGNATHEGAHFPFNFELTYLNKDHNAAVIVDRINHWFTNMPQGKIANWVAGNHDQKRITTRYGTERADGIIMLLLLLPGISVTYQGEEIGMENFYLTFNETQDPQACKDGPERYNLTSRDPARTPMQWDDTTSAGFSTNTSTWLPIPETYINLNLMKQKTADRSTYKMYKALSEVRREDVVVKGNFTIKTLQENALAFTRVLNDDVVVVVLNTGDSELRVDLNANFMKLEENLKVVVASVASPRSEGDKMPSNNILLYPYESLVLKNSATVLQLQIVMLLFFIVIHFIMN